MKKVAALDLGTNTFLCLIAEGDRTGIAKVNDDLMKVVRLGQDIDRTGRLHPEALQRAEMCLSEFKEVINRHGVQEILAMATSAARDAENGEELFAIGKKLGIPIQIIEGSKEAELTYFGAMVGQDLSSLKTRMVIDVGGGSTEYIVGRSGRVHFAKSLDMGGVRLTERFITHQPVSEIEKDKLISFVDQQLMELSKDMENNQVSLKDIEVIAVAGTPTSIAAIELGGFEESKVHNFTLTLSQLEKWMDRFKELSVSEIRDQYGLGGRSDIIFAGATILARSLKHFKVHSMKVSTKGVRYGVAMELLKD